MKIDNYVAGWRQASDGGTAERRNPADARDVVGTFAESGAADVDAAVDAATQVFPEWAGRSILERAVIVERAGVLLRERSGEIGRCLSLEEGKPLAEAVGEVVRAAEVLAFSAAFGRRPTGAVMASSRPGVELRTHRRPVGVVGVITPFNFPAFVPSLKIGPGLVAGNCLVWKPSPDTPFTGALMVQALVDAGLPDGVISYLTGTTPSAGEALVAHPGVHAVTFTGSTGVGRRIEVDGVRTGKRVQAEMGGVNPLVVLADADVAQAASAAAEGAFGGTGQKCTATRRVFVDTSVREQFLRLVCDRARSIRLGNGLTEGVEIGPLVSERARARVQEQITALAEAGGNVLVGGGAPAGDEFAYGWFFQPTVIADVPLSNALVDEEIFGPVLLVHEVDGLDEALDYIAPSRFGLSAGIFTDSHRAIATFTSSVESGLISVNLPTTGVEPQASFGGLRSSGSGPKEVGQDAMQFYTQEVTIAVSA